LRATPQSVQKLPDAGLPQSGHLVRRFVLVMLSSLTNSRYLRSSTRLGPPCGAMDEWNLS
jgi:hypothetical protein